MAILPFPSKNTNFLKKKKNKQKNQSYIIKIIPNFIRNFQEKL